MIGCCSGGVDGSTFFFEAEDGLCDKRMTGEVGYVYMGELLICKKNKR